MDALKSQLTSVESIIFWGAVFLALLLLSSLYVAYSKIINPFVFRWRWLLAGFLLVVLVIFEVSGSSLAMWGKVLPGHNYDGLILGAPKEIRTDEWATTTAMTFAQFNDESSFLPYFGNVFRASPTDMFIVSQQPVLDIAMVFKPFHWGFLFLGLAKGLSFYWCAKIILLFMLTFELGMRLFKGSKLTSLALALLVAFSPLSAWWDLEEIIIYAEALLLLFIFFLTKSGFVKKVLIGVGFFLLIGAYALILYPAWQIPFAILFLVIGITYIIMNKKEIRFSLKTDLLSIIPGILLVGFGLYYIISHSSEAISLLSNTAYPGNRSYSGGGYFEALFRFPINLFSPLDDLSTYGLHNIYGTVTNHVDEFAMYIDFFPLGLIFAIYLIFIKRVKNLLLNALFFFTCFLIIYVVFGLPDWLSKITLMSYSISARAVTVASFSNLILLLYSVSLLGKPRKVGYVIAFAFAYSLAITLTSWFFQPDYFGSTKVTLSVIVLAITLSFLLLQNKKWFALCALALALFTNALVNPVQLGIAPVQNDELIEDIRSVKSTSDDNWLSLTTHLENLTTLAGAETVNSTHVYPNFSLWEILDPDKSDMDTYNRYAHMRFELENSDTTETELIGDDLIDVKLGIGQLEQLEIGYIATTETLDAFNANNYGVHFEILSTYNGFWIYEVTYD